MLNIEQRETTEIRLLKKPKMGWKIEEKSNQQNSKQKTKSTYTH